MLSSEFLIICFDAESDPLVSTAEHCTEFVIACPRNNCCNLANSNLALIRLALALAHTPFLHRSQSWWRQRYWTANWREISSIILYVRTLLTFLDIKTLESFLSKYAESSSLLLKEIDVLAALLHLFVQCRDKTHQPLFTSQIIGYLNSIIIIIMVTAAINANDCLDVQTRTLKRKKLEANRG